MESVLLPASIVPKIIPQISITVNHKKGNALLDTGASHCFIQKDIAYLLGAQLSMNRLPKVTIGNATTMSPLGSCKLVVQIDNTQYHQEFFVFEFLPFGMILGTDFIARTGLLIDIGKGYCYRGQNPAHKIQFTNKDMLCALQGLDKRQERELYKVLDEFPTVLTDKIGCTNMVRCKLEVQGPPIAQKPYPTSQMKKEIISQNVEKLLKLGFIRPSKSEWASPVTLQKQNGEYRFCLDYRKVNQRTKSDPFPIPRMEALLGKLGAASFVSKIDLRKGYWQIAMEPVSIPQTAFICDDGKFEFLRMPFGLKTAPSIFQRFVNNMLGNARGQFADAYIDDIIIYSNSWAEHLNHIRDILHKIRKAGMTANVEKCVFGKTSIKYLGFIITPEGVSTDPEKVAPIANYPIPKNPKEIKRFLGLCGWYRHYVEHFATVAEPLNGLLQKGRKFHWGNLQQEAFCRLKSAIANSITLAFPDFNRPFILRTDASDVGLGAVLCQKAFDGLETPIAFASRSLTQAEKAYHATEKECLGIVWALKKFVHYLDGQQFVLQTDNRALTWLDSMKDANSKFMRWSLKIQDFQPSISHCPGSKNVVADALSRAPVGLAEEEEIKEEMSPPINASLLSILVDISPTVTFSALLHAQSNDNECSALKTNMTNDFCINNGLLCRLSKTGAKLPYIPACMRSDVLNYFHDFPISGHLGHKKTLNRILRRVFWNGMHEDIFRYVKSCSVCQHNKNPNSKPNGDLQSVKSNGPWDMLAMDFMGPLPTTKNGNTQLLVVVDHYSKWVECFPLRDGRAFKICRILENEIFLTWGTPKSILTDNGSNFRSKVLRDFLEAWNVKHKVTSTYHPQCNITERVNRNIRAILASYINNKHNTWDEHLAAVSFALRSAVSDSTGFSPALLNLGRELRLPFDNALESDSAEFESRIEYKRNLIARLQKLYSQVSDNVEKSQARQKKYYNARHKQIRLQVNDLVLLRSHYLSDKSKKFNKKFAPRWLGPYTVQQECSPVTYRLGELENGNSVGVHNIKNLKVYNDRPPYLTDPLSVVKSREPISHNEASRDSSTSDQNHSYNLRSGGRK